MSGIPVHCGRTPRQPARSQTIKSPTLPSENLPGTQHPPGEDRTDDLAAADIDVPREQHRHVVRRRERVRGDVGAEGGERPGEGGEERGSAVVPLVDELEGVPEDLAVQHDARGGHHDADEAAEGKCDWDDGELDVLSAMSGVGFRLVVKDNACDSRSFVLCVSLTEET